jgi:hypothetical protein
MASTWREVTRVKVRAAAVSIISSVVTIDGKTLRGSKRDRSGSGALHVVSAYAHEDADRLVAQKSWSPD